MYKYEIHPLWIQTTAAIFISEVGFVPFYMFKHSMYNSHSMYKLVLSSTHANMTDYMLGSVWTMNISKKYDKIGNHL